MSAEDVRAVLERRKQHPYEPRLAGVTGTYRFDIEGVGRFFVSVDDGYLQVAETARDAECIIALDADTFLRVADGRQNLVTAFMQGLVTIRGDLSLAQKLHGIMPGPQAAPAQPEQRS